MVTQKIIFCESRLQPIQSQAASNDYFHQKTLTFSFGVTKYKARSPSGDSEQLSSGLFFWVALLRPLSFSVCITHIEIQGFIKLLPRKPASYSTTGGLWDCD